MIEVISQVVISTIVLLSSIGIVKLPPKPYHQDAKVSVSTSKDKLDKKEKISTLLIKNDKKGLSRNKRLY